jgi:hypothetical protein
MNYFTQGLYARCNAGDEAIAEAAQAEWETAIERYHRDLAAIRDRLTDNVRQLAEEICLHDYEILSCQSEPDVAESQSAGREPRNQSLIMKLADQGHRVGLTYQTSGPIEQTSPIGGWPFSTGKVYWLYDEIDLDPTRGDSSPGFVHRVFLSNGSERTIPFRSVSIETAPRVRVEPSRTFA